MMRKIGMQFAVLILIICGTAAVLAGLMGKPSASDNGLKQRDSEAAADELKLLLSLSKEQVTGPIHMTVKLQGEGKELVQGGMGEELHKLAGALGLSEAAVKENSENAYRARDTVGAVQVRLDWVQKNGRSYVKIQLNGGHADMKDMLQLQRSAWEAMTEAEIQPSWNASAQGTAKLDASRDDIADRLEESLSAARKLKRVDTYEDAAAISRSYHVPSLFFQVKSAAEEIQMQTAVHKDRISGLSRITIGFPVITVEY